MSMVTMACVVCGETYMFGMVGTTMHGGHICPVRVQRDELVEAARAVVGARMTGEGLDVAINDLEAAAGLSQQGGS